MKKKTLYESPEAEIVLLSEKDVVTTSNGIGADGGNNEGEWTESGSNRTSHTSYFINSKYSSYPNY